MEEVRKAREASIRRLENREEPAEQKEASVQKEPAVQKPAEPASLYDTSRLDVSAIVGLDEELQKTLNMVDELSGRETGGERR